MPDELLESVERHLKPYLDLKGFSRSKYEYTPEQFGDSFIMFSSDQYWFFLSKDRGQVFAEVGPRDSPPSIYNYFDLWYVAEFLKHGEFPRDYSGSTDQQVARISQFLLTHWDEIFTPELLAIRADELRAYIRERQRGRLSESDYLPEGWAKDNPLKVKGLIESLMQKAAAVKEAGNQQAAILLVEEAVRLAKQAGAPDAVLKKMREPYA